MEIIKNEIKGSKRKSFSIDEESIGGKEKIKKNKKISPKISPKKKDNNRRKPKGEETFVEVSTTPLFKENNMRKNREHNIEKLVQAIKDCKKIIDENLEEEEYGTQELPKIEKVSDKKAKKDEIIKQQLSARSQALKGPKAKLVKEIEEQKAMQPYYLVYKFDSKYNKQYYTNKNGLDDCFSYDIYEANIFRSEEAAQRFIDFVKIEMFKHQEISKIKLRKEGVPMKSFINRTLKIS